MAKTVKRKRVPVAGGVTARRAQTARKARRRGTRGLGGELWASAGVRARARRRKRVGRGQLSAAGRELRVGRPVPRGKPTGFFAQGGAAAKGDAPPWCDCQAGWNEGPVGSGSLKDRGMGERVGLSAQAARDVEVSCGFSRRRTRRRRYGRGYALLDGALALTPWSGPRCGGTRSAGRGQRRRRAAAGGGQRGAAATQPPQRLLRAQVGAGSMPGLGRG